MLLKAKFLFLVQKQDNKKTVMNRRIRAEQTILCTRPTEGSLTQRAKTLKGQTP